MLYVRKRSGSRVTCPWRAQVRVCFTFVLLQLVLLQSSVQCCIALPAASLVHDAGQSVPAESHSLPACRKRLQEQQSPQQRQQQ